MYVLFMGSRNCQGFAGSGREVILPSTLLLEVSKLHPTFFIYYLLSREPAFGKSPFSEAQLVRAPLRNQQLCPLWQLRWT